MSSFSYSIYTTIDLEFSLNSIRQILEGGSKLGYRYFFESSSHRERKECGCIFLSPEDVLDALEAAWEEKSIITLSIDLHESSAGILFVNKSGFLCIVFTAFSLQWSKRYPDGTEDIDIHRYAHAMLDLVNDYKIIKMEISYDD